MPLGLTITIEVIRSLMTNNDQVKACIEEKERDSTISLIEINILSYKMIKSCLTCVLDTGVN